MMEEAKEEVRLLRKNGMRYRQIAEYVGVPDSSAWRIFGEKDLADLPIDKEIGKKILSHEACAYCGGKIKKAATGRTKRFCSEKCRRAYWKIHRDEMKKNPEAIYLKVCPYCGKAFEVYGNKIRKYCCHEHYVLDRFGSSNQ